MRANTSAEHPAAFINRLALLLDSSHLMLLTSTVAMMSCSQLETGLRVVALASLGAAAARCRCLAG